MRYTYDSFCFAMATLKHAKNSIRAQRGTGNLADGIARNRAIALLNDAEYTLVGEYARQCREGAARSNV